MLNIQPDPTNKCLHGTESCAAHRGHKRQHAELSVKMSLVASWPIIEDVYIYIYMHIHDYAGICIYVCIYAFIYSDLYICVLIYLFPKQLHEKSKNLGSPKESHRIKPRSFSISFQAAWLRLILGGKRSAR